MSNTASLPPINHTGSGHASAAAAKKADGTGSEAIKEPGDDDQGSEFTQLLASLSTVEISDDTLEGDLAGGNALPLAAETAKQDLPETVLASSLLAVDKLADTAMKSTETAQAVKAVLSVPQLNAQQTATQLTMSQQMSQQAGLLKKPATDSALTPVLSKPAVTNAALNLQIPSLQSGETDKLFSAQMKNILSDSFKMPSSDARSAPIPLSTQLDPASASSLRLPMMPTMTSELMSAAPQQTTLGEAFGRPGWNQGMAKQVVWMVNQNIRSAEIRLNPANLGPVEVRIDMKDEQVSVAFSSRHAVVREAVEMSLPRLREMLESNGLNLADTDVSQHSFSEQRNQQAGNDLPRSSFSGFTTRGAEVSAEAVSHSAIPVTMNNGLVDYFA